MLALLLAVALIGLIVLALLLAGALVAAVTGVLVLNAWLVVLALRRGSSQEQPDSGPERERWQPSAFRRPPELPGEPTPAPDAGAELPALRVHRL